MKKPNACAAPTRRSLPRQPLVTVLAPGRTRTVRTRRTVGWPGANAVAEVGIRVPPPEAGMHPMCGLKLGARAVVPT